MWILESRSDFFQGRRIWLKPGKQYLFGRVKKDGVSIALNYKTVSRKHFVIKVDNVEEQNVGNVHVRTKIVVIDQGSKTGTQVNDAVSVKDQPQELKLAENIINPTGRDDQVLIVSWVPCVLTFNLLKKEAKAGVLKHKQARVRELDIKAISEYVSTSTTHLVAQKRNTAKGLQALIDAKWLVSESYIDALIYASTPSDLEEEENLCPLEQDFDAHWPDPADHLPPPGRELTTRPTNMYRPDTARRSVFDGCTFVFTDSTQYENLLPPITLGHGKALLFTAVEETTVDELVGFLRTAAGVKVTGDASEADIDGAFLVKCRAEDAEWLHNLISQVSTKVGRRPVDQGEFLDTVLGNDASLLKQPVPTDADTNAGESYTVAIATKSVAGQRSDTETTGLTLNHESLEPEHDRELQTKQSEDPVAHAHTDQVDENTSSGAVPPPRKRARFVPPERKKFSFDDEFDADAIVPFEEEIDHEELSDATPQPEQENVQTRRSIDSGSKKILPQKRPHSSSRETSTVSSHHDDDEFEGLAPAAARMKRRQLATRGIVPAAAASILQPKKGGIRLPAAKRYSDGDINIKQELRAKREERKIENAKMRADEQEDIVLDEDGRLPIYEIQTELIDIPRQLKSASISEGSHNDRWDPKWNGRKNFKGFRRARDKCNGDEPRDYRKNRHTRIIVPLVDARQNTYGIGDQYWEKSEEDRARERKKKDKERAISQKSGATQSTTGSGSKHSQRSVTVHDSGSDVEVTPNGAENGEANTPPRISHVQREAEEVTGDTIDLETSRRARASGTQTVTNSLVELRGTKRPASRGSGRRETKKSKAISTNDSGDDSDDMKFKFGSRRGKTKTSS